MKLWLEILQLRPIDGVLLDLDEGADARPAADPAAVEIDQVGMMDDDAFIHSHVRRDHFAPDPSRQQFNEAVR